MGADGILWRRHVCVSRSLACGPDREIAVAGVVSDAFRAQWPRAAWGVDAAPECPQVSFRRVCRPPPTAACAVQIPLAMAQAQGVSAGRDGAPVHREHLLRAQSAGHQRRARGPFRRFAQGASAAVGKPWAFAGAAGIVVVWAALGPLFKFSDTWQLVINTGTTIITFLMVFLIQNTQNRDTEALRLKLDELILATRDARNAFVDIEDLDDEQLSEIERELRSLAGKPG